MIGMMNMDVKMTDYEIGVEFFDMFDRLHEAEGAACAAFCASRGTDAYEMLKKAWHAASFSEIDWIHVFLNACYDARITKEAAEKIRAMLYGLIDKRFSFKKNRKIVERIGKQLRLKSYEERLMYSPDYTWGDWVLPVVYGAKQEPELETKPSKKTTKNRKKRKKAAASSRGKAAKGMIKHN